jgi:hypothetical protein
MMASAANRECGQDHRGHEMEIATLLVEDDQACAPVTGDAQQREGADKKSNGCGGARPELCRCQRAPREHESDDEYPAEHEPESAVVGDRPESCRHHHAYEPRDVDRAPVLARVTLVADRREPHEVDQRERRGVEQRRSPPSPYQHRGTDRDDHRDAHAGAQQGREAGQEPEVVAPVHRTFVVSEQEVHDAEDQRSDKGHLDRQDDVLVAAPEEDEDQRRDRRRPRPYTGAPHHGPNQQRRAQVQQHDDDLIGAVGPEPEHPPQGAKGKRREGDPVLVVRLEEIVNVESGPDGQEVPLVLEEPHRARNDHVEDERAELAEHEDDERAPPAYWLVVRLRHSGRS